MLFCNQYTKLLDICHQHMTGWVRGANLSVFSFCLRLNWSCNGLSVRTLGGDFRRRPGGDSAEDRGTLSAPAKLDPKGQEGVSEFNLITREGPAEPVELFIQPTVCETKENVNSGTRIMENPPNIPAVAPKILYATLYDVCYKVATEFSILYHVI